MTFHKWFISTCNYHINNLVRYFWQRETFIGI